MSIELSQDMFWGGKIILEQPTTGYRVGNDAVLLAASTTMGFTGSVLDVGSGVGAVGLMIAKRHEQVHVSGVERDEVICDVSRQNAIVNKVSARFVAHAGDMFVQDPRWPQEGFDHVVTNPPFFSRRMGLNENYRTLARSLDQDITLAQWLFRCMTLVRHRGWLRAIFPVQALPEVLGMLSGRAGNIHCLPLCARAGDRATRVLLAAQRNVKTSMSLLSPLVMHQQDGSYTAEVDLVLRNGSLLEGFEQAC